jgi:hypothetical protein
MEKINVTKKIEEISIYDLELSLDGLIHKFVNIKQSPEANGYSDLQVRLIRYDDDEHCSVLYIFGTRLETDKELLKREKDQAKSEIKRTTLIQKAKENELKLYKKLSKKYGPLGDEQ